MTQIIETRQLADGYKVVVKYDHDCPDPRDWDGAFFWLSFGGHRNYSYGDETIRPEDMRLRCSVCAGTGLQVNGEGDEVSCLECSGYGELEPRTLDDVLAWAQQEYQPLVVRPTSMHEHGLVNHFVDTIPLGPRDWDTSRGTGLIMFLPSHLQEWGNDSWAEDDIVKQMDAELELYTEWCNGACYFVELLDRNDDTVDEMAGLVGDELLEETIKDMTSDLPEPPDPLIDVRLTADEITLIRRAIGGEALTDIELCAALRLDLKLKEATR